MKVEVLGNVQDGGVPHLGCSCEVCEAARDDPRKQKYVCSLLLKENNDNKSVRYLIDASPDIQYQIRGEYLDGVFVSHGDLGHIAGLPFFGTEALDTDGLAVHCTEEMANFIMNNDPYRLLVDRGNIQLHQFDEGDKVEIKGGSIGPREIRHSHVNTDTTSFMINGNSKKLYYMSDIDEWTENAIENVKEADIAIVDGTFWSKEEIGRYEEVPHPTIPETMELFAGSDTEIYFTHINHTNPVLKKDSEERKDMERKGFGIVEKGQEFEI